MVILLSNNLIFKKKHRYLAFSLSCGQMDRHLKCPLFESGDQIQIYILKNKYYKIDIKLL